MAAPPPAAAPKTDIRVWWTRALILSVLLAAGCVVVGYFAEGGSAAAGDDPRLAGIPLGPPYLVLTAIALVLLATALGLSYLSVGVKVALAIPIAYGGAGVIIALVAGKDALGMSSLIPWIRPTMVALAILALSPFIGIASLMSAGPERWVSHGRAKAARVGEIVLRISVLFALLPVALGVTLLVRELTRKPPEETANTTPPPPPEPAPTAPPPAPPPQAEPEPTNIPTVPAGVDRHGDPLLRGTIARLGTLRAGKGTRLENHVGSGHLVFSPDGKTLASLGSRGLLVWSVEKGTQEVELVGVPRTIGVAPSACNRQSFAFAQGGETIVLPNEAVWRVANGERVRDIRDAAARGGDTTFSADGGRYVTIDATGLRHVVEVASGKRVVSIKLGHDSKAAALSPDGLRLASIGGKSIEIHPAGGATKKVVKELEAATPTMLDLAFASDGKSIVVAYVMGSVPPGGSPTRSIVRVVDAETGNETRRFAEAPVSKVAFSPDGKSIAAWGTTLVVWDAATGAERVRADSPGVGCRPVAFSPDGTKIAVVSSSKDDRTRLGTLSVHEVADGKVLFSHDTGPQSALHSLAFSPDNKTLAVSRTDGIHRYDAESGAERGAPPAERPGHWGPIVAVAVSPNGDLVATRSKQGEIRVWKASTGEPVAAVQARDTTVGGSLLFTPDGAALASQDGNAVHLFDPQSGKVTGSLGADVAGSQLAFSSDGSLLAEAGAKTRLWDPKSSRQVRALGDPGERAEATAIAFTPDGKKLVQATYELASPPLQKISVWDASEGKRALSFDTPHRIQSIAVTSDGAQAVACADGKTAIVYDLSTGKEKRRLGGLRLPLAHQPGRDPAVSPICVLSPDGTRIAVGVEASIRILGLSGEEMLTVDARGHPVQALAWTPDGKKIVTGGEDTTALVWDLDALATVATERVPLSYAPLGARAIVTVPRSDAFAYAGVGGGVWDLAAWERRARLDDLPPGPPKPVAPGTLDALRFVATSGDGKIAAVAGADRAGLPVLRTMDAATGKRLQKLATEAPKALALSPDGATIVILGEAVAPAKTGKLRAFVAKTGLEVLTGTGNVALTYLTDGSGVATFGDKGAIELVDVPSGKKRATLSGQPEGAGLLAMSPDGALLASASGTDAPVRLWDVKAGALAREVSAAPFGVRALAISTQGVVAAASTAYELVLFSAKTGEEIARLRTPGAIVGLAFSADGRTLAGAADSSGDVYFWKVPAI